MTQNQYYDLWLAMADDNAAFFESYQGGRWKTDAREEADWAHRWIEAARTKEAERCTPHSAKRLSDLQKRLLVEAYTMRQQYGIPVWMKRWRDLYPGAILDIHTAPDLYFYEALHTIMNIPYTQGYRKPERVVHPRQSGNGLKHFSEDTPGLAAAKASLSRAIQRLIERGLLVDWTWGCVQLTDLGLRVARELVVNGIV